MVNYNLYYLIQNDKENDLTEIIEGNVSKFRLHCQHLIISSRARNRFFESSYDEFFNKTFYEFFKAKIRETINIIIVILPKTRIEEV